MDFPLERSLWLRWVWLGTPAAFSSFWQEADFHGAVNLPGPGPSQVNCPELPISTDRSIWGMPLPSWSGGGTPPRCTSALAAPCFPLAFCKVHASEGPQGCPFCLL